MATTRTATTRPDTRARILDTAWELLRDRGAEAVTVAQIADAAGVSRQLVYVHFENRAGLLLATARHYDARSGFRDRVAAARSLPPVGALERLLRLWCAYIPEVLPVARALDAGATGDGSGAALRDRFDDLREAFRLAVERVAADGRLAGGWTVATATDWVWARSHLTTWRQLVDERGWTPEDYTERTVRSILAEIVRDPRDP